MSSAAMGRAGRSTSRRPAGRRTSRSSTSSSRRSRSPSNPTTAGGAARMDRRRATGVALVLVSAAAFGSGSLFAQPVYAAGVDWMTLSAWRFLFGAALTWGFLLLSADRRLALRSQTRGAVIAGIALGVMYVGNSGTYYASLETVSPSL